ncbi:MAG: hypothetical protein IPH55_13780 [Betaproteobacteria bacterium]|nr:hypothetical protein [Betaproteobacteria bacterium]
MALIRHPKDFGAGVLFAPRRDGDLHLQQLSARDGGGMGPPGYFPRMLGILLLALAAILILRSFFLRGPAPAMRNLKPLVIVLGGVFLFGVAAPLAGHRPRHSC